MPLSNFRYSVQVADFKDHADAGLAARATALGDPESVIEVHCPLAQASLKISHICAPPKPYRFS